MIDMDLVISVFTLQVFDSCGMAGGGPQQQPGEAKYIPTKFAKQGDLARDVLPPAPSGITWKIGGTATVKWSLRTNHGGGYDVLLLASTCPVVGLNDQKRCSDSLSLSLSLSFEGVDQQHRDMSI